MIQVRAPAPPSQRTEFLLLLRLLSIFCLFHIFVLASHFPIYLILEVSLGLRWFPRGEAALPVMCLMTILVPWMWVLSRQVVCVVGRACSGRRLLCPRQNSTKSGEHSLAGLSEPASEETREKQQAPGEPKLQKTSASGTKRKRSMKEDKGKKSTSPQISFPWVKKTEEFSEGIEKVGGKKSPVFWKPSTSFGVQLTSPAPEAFFQPPLLKLGCLQVSKLWQCICSVHHFDFTLCLVLRDLRVQWFGDRLL